MWIARGSSSFPSTQGKSPPSGASPCTAVLGQHRTVGSTPNPSTHRHLHLRPPSSQLLPLPYRGLPPLSPEPPRSARNTHYYLALSCTLPATSLYTAFPFAPRTYA